jgi:hypothetical protein
VTGPAPLPAARRPAWVLLHSPATGPLTWQPVAEVLRAAGERVAVPDLRGTLTGEPGWAGRQVRAAAEQAAVDGPRVLVGHSWSGTLIPAVGALLGDVSAYLFVDASLPRPGRSFADTVAPDLLDLVRQMAPDGAWTRPWWQWWGEAEMAQALPDPAVRAAFCDQCRPLPLGMFGEPALEVPGFPDAPCGYLRLSPAYDLDDARALGWRVADLPSDHLGMVTAPAAVVARLLDLAGLTAATVTRVSDEQRGFTPDRSNIDPSRDPNPGVPDHLAPDDAGERPFIDLSRDPTPGRPDHAAPEDDES